jgi:hypothetical protein
MFEWSVHVLPATATVNLFRVDAVSASQAILCPSGVRDSCQNRLLFCEKDCLMGIDLMKLQYGSVLRRLVKQTTYQIVKCIK